MSVSFLFWNVFKKPLQPRVARLASVHSVDVLMLAECGEVSPGSVLEALNTPETQAYSHHDAPGAKVRIFSRFSDAAVEHRFNDPLGALSIWELKVGRYPGVLLAVVHLPGKINWERDDQTLQATTFARDIARTEDEVGHLRTVLVGDLNMHPFDPGCAGANALHGVMATTIARKRDRVVRGAEFRYFYNPMWGCFGDRTPGPPGSYYLSSSKPLNYFWAMYDQVLLRPDLMDTLVELRVLDNDGTTSLLTRDGLPRTSNGSDHLPILFRLDL